MSVETRLAALRMEFKSQESELLATKCANCNHELLHHSRVRPEVCIGGGRWPCRCKGFAEARHAGAVR
jgi:hypothetical protein